MQSTIDSSKAQVSGFVAPGFEEVRAEFERILEERGEIGAAVAAYWRGEKVVDLWVAAARPEGDEPLNEDTLIVFMSSTKGLAAMTLALDNDDPREKPLRDAVYRAIRRGEPSPSRSIRAGTPEREPVYEGGRTGGVR